MEIEKYTVITTKNHMKELRQKSEAVDKKEIGTKKFNKFLEKLRVTMMEEPMKPGWMPAGISAVQVGIHKQVFYAYDSNNEKYKIYINPEIEYLGQTQRKHIESCLSVPDTIGEVRRYRKIKISYLDENGKNKEKNTQDQTQE